MTQPDRRADSVRALCEELHGRPLHPTAQRDLMRLLLGEDTADRVIDNYRRRLRIALEDLASDPADTDAQCEVLQMLTGVDVASIVAANTARSTGAAIGT